MKRVTLHPALRRYLLSLLEVTVLLAFVTLGLFIFAKIATLILPFVIGFIIAVILFPLVHLLERWGLSRRVSIVVTLVLVIALMVGLVGYLTVQGAEEAISLSQSLPHYFHSWASALSRLIEQAMAVYGHLPPKIVTTVQSAALSVVDQMRQLALSVLSGLFTGVAFLPDAIVVVVISVVAAYFFMAQRESLLDGLRKVLPPGWAPKLGLVASDVGRALAGLARAQVILILVTSVICVIGLFIMGVRYALILGTLIGLTGWVPILGSGIVTLPWAIGAVALGNYVLAIKILLLQAVASLVRHTIEPKILAANMELGTFATLFGMYVGLTSMGFIGLLLGPILLIALRSLIRARMFVDFFPAEDKQIVVPHKAPSEER